MTVFYYILFCITQRIQLFGGYYKLNWEQLFPRHNELHMLQPEELQSVRKEINEKIQLCQPILFFNQHKEKRYLPSSFKEGKNTAT